MAALARCCLILPLIMASPPGASATGNSPQISAMCDQAAVRAADTSNVPLSVLRTISRAETGRASPSGLQPWPWTVNMEGKGRWFDNLDEARSYVFSHFKTGARSFDVGCFQINYKWHGEAFRSIDDMFDPVLNARYAASFLTKLYQEFGNWPDAAGAYHSRTPKYADKYTARFKRIKADLSGGSDQALAYQSNDGRTPRRTSGSIQAPSPLTNGQITLGSLVPIQRQPGANIRPFVALK